MSGDTVIRVEGLSKRYMLGKARGGDSGLRHVIEETLRKPADWLRGRRTHASGNPNNPQEFWALDDVSFDIKKGEIVGIIGRNGAGKSTLLKVLSRITEPTRGKIGIKGRVASLLEVGTGFHPELSGRENIFLNGAILGMRQTEVRAKLDEIVAFAGVEKFLETPVKRYSSGMYVRLAFAVAAHLEPEILIIDEVLAVGDAEFQKKCLGKMRDVTRGGRTVLFVSHNLSAIAGLCQRGIYLKGGRVMMAGAVDNVMEAYKADTAFEPAVVASVPESRRGTGTHRIQSVVPATLESEARDPLKFRVEIKRHRDEGPFNLCLFIWDDSDVRVLAIDTEYLEDLSLTSGDQSLEIDIRSPWLRPGDYRIDAYLHGGGIIDDWPGACSFRVSHHVGRKGYSFLSHKNASSALAEFSITARNQGPCE